MANGKLQFSAAIDEHLKDELAEIEERRAQGEEVEEDPRPSILFGLENDPYDEEFEAYEPTTSQIALFLSAGDGDTVESISSMFNFLRATLSYNSFRRLKQRVNTNNRYEQIEMTGLVNVMKGVVEYWTGGFPTKPSPVSSGSQPSTGSRSTGRSPGKASTRSTSSRAGTSATSTRGRTSA